MTTQERTLIICNTPTINLEHLKNEKNWQRKYKSIITCSKQLPENYLIRKPSNLVTGCEAKTWLFLDDSKENTTEVFMDSESAVVKGLCCVILTAIHEKTLEQVVDFDIHCLMTELQLEKHLTPSRVNGLLAVWARIKNMNNN